MQDLTVTLIQTALYWEDIGANQKMFDEKICSITEKTDLIILPEMFTTGFSMNPVPLAEKMTGTTVAWIKQKAIQKQAHVLGSAIIFHGGRYYNRLLWATPDGGLKTYDKKHLFRMIGEHEIYSAGNGILTVDVNGWRIRPFICYDMRFPAWTRNLENEYDLAIYIANWPEKRSGHWKLLMPARAVENQCYVIGVNRVGEDGNGFYHSGDSAVIDPMGNILFEKAHESCIKTLRLQYDVVTRYRETFPAWRDADRFTIVTE